MSLHPSVAKILDETQGLPAGKRLERLHEALKEAVAVRKLNALESISFSFGGGGLNAFNVEHPQYDSGNYPWTAVTGITGAYLPANGYSLLTDDLSLENARKTCRRLAAENEFAIGAHRLRRSYIMGNGIGWHVSPRDLEKENERLTKRANETIREFMEHNKWRLMEREIVMRVDRDGECFLRTFINAGGPLTVRFIEPELIRTPSKAPERAMFGVQMGARNESTVEGYWLHKHVSDDSPKLLKAMQPMGPEIPQVIHIKGNTDMDQKRGWPLMWPVRKNLDRAEKLLRNMSVVATLQAAIAVVRKHEAATQADVSNFLQDNEDFNWTDQISGTRQSAKGIGGDMGLVLDAGPGFSYETPISSVNASVNVEVLRAELRSCAASLNMPESMFTSMIDGSFAGSLVAEAPFVKYMEGEQLFFGEHLRPLLEAHIAHEVWWRRLPPKVQKDYMVKGEFTSLEVRDFLREAQKRQLENDAGVLSLTTWRAKSGYDEAVERRNLEKEHEEAVKRAQELMPPPADESNGLSADNGQNDGKGGADQARQRGGDQPDTNFAQKDAQHLAEAGIYPDQEDAISTIMQRFGHLMGKDEGSSLVLKLIGILTDSRVDSKERVAAALNLLATLEADAAPADEGDAGGEAVPGLPI